jgi:hypothetical protein
VQGDQLCDLALCQHVDLEIKAASLLRQLQLVVLRNQDHGGDQQRADGRKALQEGEGWWIKCGTAQRG